MEAHAGQYREGELALPYIAHPMEVLIALRQVGGVTEEEMLCAAILHDVLEETSTAPDVLGTQFGFRVQAMVVELTRYEPSISETYGLDKDGVWQLRSETLLAEIEKMTPNAMTVKLADRLSNLKESKRFKKGQKLERYFDQTQKILRIVPESLNPGLWRAIRTELGV